MCVCGGGRTPKNVCVAKYAHHFLSWMVNSTASSLGSEQLENSAVWTEPLSAQSVHTAAAHKQETGNVKSKTRLTNAQLRHSSSPGEGAGNNSRQRQVTFTCSARKCSFLATVARLAKLWRMMAKILCNLMTNYRAQLSFECINFRI